MTTDNNTVLTDDEAFKLLHSVIPFEADRLGYIRCGRIVNAVIAKLGQPAAGEADIAAKLLDPAVVQQNMLLGKIAKIDMATCAHTHGEEMVRRWRAFEAWERAASEAGAVPGGWREAIDGLMNFRPAHNSALPSMVRGGDYVEKSAVIRVLSGLEAAPPAPSQQAAPDAEPDAKDTLAQLYDLFSIGAQARQPHILLENVRNSYRRARCLSAVECVLSVPVPPEPEDDGVWGEESLLNWGASPEGYADHFKAALADFQQRATPAAESAEPTRCEYCDGTGDVHRPDGEWRGECKVCKPTAVTADAQPKSYPNMNMEAEPRTAEEYDLSRVVLPASADMQGDERAALQAVVDAHESLFMQALSNPIKNAWGVEIDLSLFNRAYELARIALSRQPSAPAIRWPSVTGVGRDAGHARAVMVYLSEVPTDSELRNIHAVLSSQPSATVSVGDWRIDTSAGRPILVYKECSVIETPQAEWVLGLIRAALAAAKPEGGERG